MPVRVYELTKDEWVGAIGLYLGNKFSELPNEVAINIKINRRTNIMTVRVKS